MNIYRINQNDNTLIISYSSKEKLYRIYFNDNKIDELHKKDINNNLEYNIENNKVIISLSNKFSNKPFVFFNDKIYSGEQEAINRHRTNLCIFIIWLLLEIIGGVWIYTHFYTISFYIIFIFITSLLAIAICIYLFKKPNHKIYLILPLLFLLQIIANINSNNALTLSDLIFMSIFFYSLWEYPFIKKINKFVLKKL